MNLYTYFRQEIVSALSTLEKQGALSPGYDLTRVTVEPPRDPSHGDIATNAALICAKQARYSLSELAEELCTLLRPHKGITTCQAAGPGFINFQIHPHFWQERLKDILQEKERYGCSQLGAEKKVNIEYVSANPTGPLHIGHCRVAVVGDVLANLLEKTGYHVTREYYINDAGGQANDLARSVYQRYLEALGHSPQVFGSYQGPYLIPIGKMLAEDEGSRWVNHPEEQWLLPIRNFSITHMMRLIRSDLEKLNIHHDVFCSEFDLIRAQKVETVVTLLRSMGLVYEGVLEPPKGKEIEDYEPRQQLLFKATEFGDTVDRPLQKSDGSWTYFASDIAYHYDKFSRDAEEVIDVWGADHGGYVKRLTTAVGALIKDKALVRVLLCQMVRFTEQGQILKMSKREGTYVSVSEALEKVGQDGLRFMMVWRKNDAAMEFDFQKVVEQTRDNPVFYVQYAYARCCSVERYLRQIMPDLDLSSDHLCSQDLSTLTDEAELALIKQLVSWPRHVETAAQAYEPHRIAYHLYELASAFHSLWTKGRTAGDLRFVFPNDPQGSCRRFALIRAVMYVLSSGLSILGIQPRQEMH